MLQAPIYQDKIIHYLIRWEMSPCAYAHVCMCGSECSDVVRKQGEKQTSDVRQSNEAARQRLAEEVKCMSGDRLGRSYPLNSSF